MPKHGARAVKTMRNDRFITFDRFISHIKTYSMMFICSVLHEVQLWFNPPYFYPIFSKTVFLGYSINIKT